MTSDCVDVEIVSEVAAAPGPWGLVVFEGARESMYQTW